MGVLTGSGNVIGKIVPIINRNITNPADSDELYLQKTLLVSIVFMASIAGFLWAGIYFIVGEITAGFIPFSYGVISIFSLSFPATRNHYSLFRSSQLWMMLLLPAGLMIALGGFFNSSAVVLWSWLTPVGALVFDEPPKSIKWFIAFLGMVLFSGLIQPYVRITNNLPNAVKLFFFVMNIGTISTIAFTLLYHFVRQTNKFMMLLQLEQEKSERLVLNILPKEVADILKVENRIIANMYEAASILFADLVGFTPMTIKMEPVEMVEMLNEIYSGFDDLVEKYGLEKIRTIGDNYMVVSGVPRPRPDHAQAMASMALEMAEFLAGYINGKGQQIQFRIGMNSGPLIAGVVGHKKFQYDVWGDAVNTASRMESHGTPGKIHITSKTFSLIQDEFICEPRGVLHIKGKGEMETYYLIGKK